MGGAVITNLCLKTLMQAETSSWVEQGLTSHSDESNSQAINYTGTDNEKITN